MDQHNTKSLSNYSKTVLTTTASSNTTHRSRQRRIVQNFLLIWMDANIDPSSKDCQTALAQLRNVANDVQIFTHRDECIDFLTEVDDKIFLIIEGTLGQQIVPLIHDIPQLDAIYLFCHNKSGHEQWTKEWVKVKGIHNEFITICECLLHDVRQCNQDSIAISFVPLSEGTSNQNLNQLEASFMYTEIFKEILLDMKHTEQSIKEFVTYCRKCNYMSPKNITRFEKEYNSNLAIWWYTYPSDIYSLLNGALRMMEGDTIINMGFFIRDLHHQIEELHQKQVSNYKGELFIVYRGQSLATTDFEKLCQTKGGLMSFNNFLSTSKDREVSMGFTEAALTKTDTVGILFQMSIDPSVSSAPFASIQEVSYFQTEEEILFSMHTVFRIGEITKIDKNSALYQVELKLTSDDDEQLRTLTERIREETSGETGWKRLGQLLLKISQFNKAEELFTVLLEQASDESEKATQYHYLGCIKNQQGDYEKAIWYFENSLEICQKTFPLNYPSLATSYNNIGLVYYYIGEHSKALSFFEKALEIRQKNLPPNHPELAISYNSIGAGYENMGEYSKSLPFYEKALEIQQKTLPPNHPSLAASYNNIGLVYDKMGEYSKALSFHEKALDIGQKTLPPNHPSLAVSYNNIAETYYNRGEYSKALSFYEKALEIRQKTFPPNHPDFAQSYNNIGGVYVNMGEWSKAFSYHEKALEIRQKSLPPNHPDLAISYNNIGLVYDKMGEYSKSVSFYEKALEIYQKTLLPNHPDLAISYNNIGSVYDSMGEYSKALSFYEEAVEIKQKALPPNHPDLATSYNSIGFVYRNIGEYSKALSFYEKALEIRQKTLPPNHPDLAISYNNIAVTYHKMGECSKALSYLERALEIFEKTLPPNHPDLASSYNNIGAVYKDMGECSKALSSHETALEIRQKTLSPNHPDFAQSYNNIATTYYNMGDYSKALSYLERALDIFQHSLPPNHPNIQSVRNSIEIVKKKL